MSPAMVWLIAIVVAAAFVIVATLALMRVDRVRDARAGRTPDEGARR